MGLTNHEVAHLWANQSQPGTRSSTGNFSFSGRAIHSYRTCIARLILNEDGSIKAYLRNSRTYSITTSTKHQSAVNNAIIHSLPIFWIDGEPSPNHDENARRIKAAFEESLKAAALARHPATRRKHLTLAAPLVTKFNEYVAFFGVTDERLFLPEDAAPLLTEIKATEERRVAQAEDDARRKQEEYDRQNAERLERWLNGEDVHPPYNLSRTYVRAKNDTLETTKGARVPLQDAISIFETAAKVRERRKALEFDHRAHPPEPGDHVRPPRPVPNPAAALHGVGGQDL